MMHTKDIHGIMKFLISTVLAWPFAKNTVKFKYTVFDDFPPPLRYGQHGGESQCEGDWNLPRGDWLMKTQMGERHVRKRDMSERERFERERDFRKREI